MANLTTRAGKGAALTHQEVDDNFTGLNNELGQKEVAANKGVANGYASLDASGRVPSGQLPSYVDDVLEFANLAAFPAAGETGKIYVALDTNKVHRWSGSAYVEISASPGSTDSVAEGTTNLYFTQARARASVSASGSLSYNSGTGVFSYTQPTNVSTFTNDAGYITSSASITGNAETATRLQTGRTIAVTGDVTGTSVAFDGSANLSFATTLANSGVTAGTYGSSSAVPVVTVDAKGRVTGVSTSAISGSLTFTGDVTGSGTTGGSTTLTLANSGVTAGSYGSASAIPVITVDAKGRLTGVSTSAVSIPSGSLTFTGDVTGSGTTGSSTALTLANSGVTAGTYTKVTVDAKGRVTTGASLASGDLPTYTGTLTSSQVTTALGYTPYNSTNPAGYITSASLSSYLPLSGGTLTGDLRFNNGGAGRIAFTDNYHGMILRGHPSDAAGTINVTDVTSLVQHSGDFRFYRTNGSINEVYFQVNATAPYWRGNTILHAGNYTSYSPSLTGSGASGTWSINVTGSSASTTGNAATASRVVYQGNRTAETGSTVSTPSDRIDFVGAYSNGYPATYGNVMSIRGGGVSQLYLGWNGGSSAATGDLYYRSMTDWMDGWGSWRRILNDSNYSSYALPLSGGSVSGTINLTNRVNGILVNSSSTASDGGAIAIQQVTAEGWTGIFADYEPYTGWGLWHDNPNNYFCFTAESATNGLRSFTVPSRTSGNRTAYEKVRIEQSNGDVRVGGAVYITTSGHLALHAGNYNSYAPTLTGGGASGTWSINVTGSAGGVAWSNVSSKPSSIMYYQGFTLDANTMDSNATGFTYAVNAPHVGPIARFSTGGGYDLWINAPYSGGGNSLSFRTRNGDNATINPWKNVLHDGNYSSYALPLSGGTLTGLLTGTAARFTNDGSSRVLYLRGTGNIIQFEDAAGTFKWEVVGRNGEFYIYKNDGTGSGYRYQIDGNGNHTFTGTASFNSAATFSTTTNFTRTDDHAISVGTIRGRAVGGQGGEYIQLYERVNIGSPAGWGSRGAPSYGLSTYGGADLATDTGSVRITTGSLGVADAGTRGLILDGNYTNGQFRHRWRKQDDGAGLPLYLDYAHGSANAFTAIARFGGGGSYREFSIYGTMSCNNGYVSDGNPWGTSNSAYFQNGITTANTTNWIYGHNYLGNAPSNGSGAQIESNGKYYSQVSSGVAMHVRSTRTSSETTQLVESNRGDHSWGIVSEFRVGADAGSDRPSILFSSGHNSETWTVGFGYVDSNFRINRDHGYRNGNWGTTMMVMDRSGNVTFTGNVTAYSDRRLKTDIKRIENAGDIVRRLEGVSFKYRDDGRDGIGLIAQDVELVLPQIVGEATSSDGSTHKNVAYGNVVAVLIEAIKELQGEVETLKHRLH